MAPERGWTASVTARRCASTLLILLAAASSARSDEAERIPSEAVALGGHEKKSIFRLGPLPGAEEPEAGFGLLVLLPGGNGSADFNMFCRRILANGAGKEYVAVQLVAPKWSEEQEIVWPTERSKVEGMGFPVVDFIEEAIADARQWKKIDRKRIFCLGWSSSGPALYEHSLAETKSAVGWFIAMSVFKPDQLPDLKAAKGNAYFLYHSPDDRVCPFRMAEDAAKKLKKKRAKVEFKQYAGGHGWHGNMYGDLRAGIAWLEKNR
ncbi:MAG: hypothetical protein HC813_01395 [Planctomycetes bacterium]|nr:hypothetical protein [Planctomycetota bacterium]